MLGGGNPRMVGSEARGWGKGRRLVPRWWQGWNVVCSLSRTIGSLPQGAVVTSPTDPTIAPPNFIRRPRSSLVSREEANFQLRETILPRRFQSLKAEVSQRVVSKLTLSNVLFYPNGVDPVLGNFANNLKTYRNLDRNEEGRDIRRRIVFERGNRFF